MIITITKIHIVSKKRVKKNLPVFAFRVTTFSKYENKQASKSTSPRAKHDKGLYKNGDKGE